MYRKAKELTARTLLLVVVLLLAPNDVLSAFGYLLALLWAGMFLVTMTLYCVEHRKT